MHGGEGLAGVASLEGRQPRLLVLAVMVSLGLHALLLMLVPLLREAIPVRLAPPQITAHLSKAKPLPIVLFGSDYWKRLMNFDVLIEEGAISPKDLSLFHYVDEPQAAWDIIKKFYDL